MINISEHMLLQHPHMLNIFRQKIKLMTLINHSVDLILPEQLCEYDKPFYSVSISKNTKQYKYHNPEIRYEQTVDKSNYIILPDPNNIIHIISNRWNFISEKTTILFGLFSSKKFSKDDISILKSINKII